MGLEVNSGEFDVLLGGTFNPIHDGHRKLLETAFALGNPIIGVTSDSLAQQTRDEARSVDPFETRKRDVSQEVEDYVEEYDRVFHIKQLEDPFRLARTVPNGKYLVVSPEEKTVRRAEKINKERLQNEYPPHTIKIVDPIYAEDGERISSTRIVNGEINEHGELLE